MADNKIRGIINSPGKKDMTSIEGDTVFIIAANDSEKGTARELEGDDDQNEFMSEELRDFEKRLREKLVEEKRAGR